MKKLLLSAFALVGFASMAMADDAPVVLATADATNWVGTDVPERPKGTNSESDNGEARHIQPLQSLEIDGYKFAFDKGAGSTEPALYWPMSTEETPNPAPQTIRLYKSVMTITAPEGTKMGKIEFKGTNGTNNSAITASVGVVSDVTTTAFTWTNSEAVNTVTITLANNFRITSMSVYAAGEVVTPPVEPETLTFAKATTLESGKYVFAIEIDGTLKLCTPVTTSKAYGYMYFDNAAEMDGDNIKASEANAFDFVVADGKCTFKDATNRYYGMDDSHFTSFQMYSELNNGCYWTVEFNTLGEAVITNTLNPTCFVLRNTSKGYNNIAPCVAPDEYVLPYLYKLQAGAGVEAVEAAEADAPAVYYNLQGVRVANPENGLYIRVQGNKATKVIK